MRILLTHLFFLVYIASFGQELTTIKVSVPNSTDEVFVVGNQENLGSWQPDRIKMKRISDFEREISLPLTFPVEFKFTRGTWNSEAIINVLSGDPNFVLKEKPSGVVYYKIRGWTNQIDEFSTFSVFKILELNSVVLNQKRKIYVSLPEGYNENVDYPVVYVTDADKLDIFEIVVQTIRQQSNFSNFPKCIVVGIWINTSERNKELDAQYGENGKRFKDYVFKEVLPFVDKNYSTSSYKAIYSHSNGAEYNHYLMFEKDNPFDAFINVSENLTDLENGQPDVIKEKYTAFLNHNTKPIKYFVASGLYDDPNRLPSGIMIKRIFDKHHSVTVAFQHRVYKSWHVDLIGHSVADAFRFIFSDYRDYSLFEKMAHSKKNDYASTKKQYVNQNEKYIKPYVEDDVSSSIIGEIIRGSKKPKLLSQYLDYEDANGEMFSLYSRAFLFYEIGDFQTSMLYLEKMIKENDPGSVQQLIRSKGKLYLEIYKKANKPDLAHKNLDVLKAKNPDMESTINEIKQNIK